MARVILRGDAGFTFTTTGGESRRLELASPLREIRPQFRQTRFVRDSLDLTARESVTVGDGVHEFTGRMRYEGDALALLEMLDAGADGQTLTYYKSLADTRFAYTVRLVNAAELLEAAPDTDLWFDGRYEVTATFRRTDSPSFTDTLSDYLYGAGTDTYLASDATDIYPDDSSGSAYLNEVTGTDITVDDSSANSDVQLKRYGGSLLTEE